MLAATHSYCFALSLIMMMILRIRSEPLYKLMRGMFNATLASALQKLQNGHLNKERFAQSNGAKEQNIDHPPKTSLNMLGFDVRRVDFQTVTWTYSI